jgi:hypothetical protein
MEILRTPQHKATATTALLVMSAALAFLADAFQGDAASWAWWLTAGDVSKAMLCGGVAMFAPRSVRPYAFAGIAWYVGQAVVEMFAYVGPDGFSAHGPWEYAAFVVLFGSTALIQRA